LLRSPAPKPSLGSLLTLYLSMETKMKSGSMKKAWQMVAAIGASFFVAVGGAHAQTAWPVKPVRWIVPYPPGASADAISRVIAQKLSSVVGQPVVVETRAGAGGDIGHAMVAKSPPDGHTVVFVVPGILTNPFYMKKAVDPFKDLLPVIQLDSVPMVMVSKTAFKPTTFAQVLEAIRAKPGAISCAASGALPQMGCELLRKQAQAEILMVPFKGQAQSTNSVIAGDVDLMFDVLGSAIPLIQTNRIRAIAVTAEKRTTFLPDVPAASETAHGFKLVTWHGVMVAQGTPPALVARMNAILNDILKDPEVRKTLETMKLDIAGGSVEDFHALLTREYATYKAALEAAGVKPE
jgi:tripartite-type tricarboxylate transporter receptor subunit TctC